MGRGKAGGNKSFRKACPIYYGVEKDVSKDEVCTDGMFVEAIKHKPMKDGHTKQRHI